VRWTYAVAMAGPRGQDFARIRPPLEGRLVRLRALEEDDLAPINRLLWQPEVSAHIAMSWPEPIAGTRAWWERTRASEDEAPFAIETLDGQLIGNCSLREIDLKTRQANLGIFVGQAFWNRGYGTDAVRTLCRFAVEEMNLQRVELHVYANNPRARRAYEKVGFKEEGRLRRGHFAGGSYVDVIVMGLLAEELLPDETPGDPADQQ
jgi:RimJ/RimL family protein N-acetyltransferase